MDDKEIGRIVVSENEDGKAVWEFEGLVTSNVKLNTKIQHFAGAINELYDLFSEEGGGGDEPIEDWQPPADWLTVPDPAENEIYLLIEVIDDAITNTVDFAGGLRKPENGYGGYGALYIDWGDGKIYSYPEFGWTNENETLKHTYTSTGQYLVKIVTEISENNVFLKLQNKNNVLICKTGSGIVFSYDNYPTYLYSELFFGARMEYFKHFGSTDSVLKGFFRNCNGLVKIEFGEPMKKVLEEDFWGCSALRILDTSEILTIEKGGFYNSSGFINSFPKCIEIGEEAFRGSYLSKIDIPNCEKLGKNALQISRIRKISIPKCESIGEYALANCEQLESADVSACETLSNGAFSGCYNLSEVSVSDECSFGENCFNGCYKLYPRPDGSIN